jgi:hypothetical protein
VKGKWVERYVVNVTAKRRKLLPLEEEDDVGLGGGAAYERSKWPDLFVREVYSAVLAAVAARWPAATTEDAGLQQEQEQEQLY